MTIKTFHEHLVSTVALYGYEHRAKPFTLKSGKLSHDYVDCRRALASSDVREMVARELSKLVSADFGGVIAGVATGGLLASIEISAMLERPHVIVLPEPKAHGKGGQVHPPAAAFKHHDFEEEDVEVCLRSMLAENAREHADAFDLAPISAVLVEDVVTSGGSSVKALRALREAGYECDRVLCVVDREEGGREALAAEGATLTALMTLADLRTATGK